MKRLSLLCFWTLAAGSLLAQTNPAPFDLSTGIWTFNGWSASSGAGNYPGNGATGTNATTGVVTGASNANMVFWTLSASDPTIAATPSGTYSSAYNASSGARMNGEGANGVSFNNTGGGTLGNAVLALNTIGRTNVQVSWTGRTISTGTRVYNIRLQYRVGTTGTWTDLATPQVYTASSTAGNNTAFGPTPLPAAVENQSVVQLRWFYYYSGSVTGARPALAIDDITVSSSGGAACTTPVDISGLTTTAGSNQVALSWTNGSCFDEMLVVASASAFTTAVPTGDGTAYTANSGSFTDPANSTFDGGVVVFKGTATSTTVTSLTNGTTYNFKVFTRKGTTWSTGVTASDVPAVASFFYDADGNTSAATGGTGVWDAATTSNWRTPTATGTLTTWSANTTPVDAVFGGTAGTVTVAPATYTAPNFNFTTTGYTLATNTTTTLTLAGNLVLDNNVLLTLAPNINTGTPVSGTVTLGGDASGTGAAGLILTSAQTTATNVAQRINLGGTTGRIFSLPVTITSAGGTGTNAVAGIVSTNPAGSTLSNTATITNNSAIKTILGATSGNSLVVNGVVSGSADLQFSAGASGGAGILLLNAANTYTGSTIFNAANSGIVRLGITNALPATTDLLMANSSSNGGILDLNGNNQAVASVTSGAGGGSITNTGIADATFTVNGTTSRSFGLVISDGINGGVTRKVNLSKAGASTLILTATNTYTGTTVVSGGTLAVNGSLAAGSAVTINNGATLAGTGTVNGTVDAQGIVSPNTTGTVGTLTTGDLTLDAGGAYNVDLNALPTAGVAGTDWDNLVTGALTNNATTAAKFTVALNGTIAGFNNSSSYTWAIGTYTGTAPAAANIVVNKAGLTNNPTGAFSINFTGNTINLVYDGSVLPLNLLSFAAQRSTEGVKATWVTANEHQVRHMELQRSADGMAFQTLLVVAAQNTAGEHRYNAVDAQPLAGRSFYRLASVDYDGSTAYSKTVAITNGNQMQAAAFVVTPNPVQQSFSLHHPAAAAGARIVVLSLDGRVLAAREPVPGSTSTEMSALELPTGSYIASFESNGERVVAPFVK